MFREDAGFVAVFLLKSTATPCRADRRPREGPNASRSAPRLASAQCGSRGGRTFWVMISFVRPGDESAMSDLRAGSKDLRTGPT